ncbi:MAG: flagellar hook-length control protein FliK [Campylobacterales bacterium]|nr:flagellar hook-length control protein FliK [Campylobacterales bacterium]
MSEQLTTLKTTAKGKGKAGALAGLLNAGKIEFKNSDKTDKSAFEKLLTAAKKTTGVEVDKNISSKTKSEQTTHVQESKVDDSTMVSIKQLLSSIKLNDKLAIEKSVKELRDVAENTKNPKTSKELKKLLALAEKADVNVQKISVEKIKDGEQTESKQQTKQKIAESDTKLKLLEQAKEVKETKPTTETKTDIKATKNELKADIKQEKKETPNLASLLQGSIKTEDKKLQGKPEVNTQNTADESKSIKTLIKENAKEVVQTANNILKKKEEPKVNTKESVQNTFKTETKDNEESKSKPVDLAELLKKEAPKEKEAPKDSSYNQMADMKATTDTDLKAKMAVAKEGLKNFSEDLKETIDNYKPPLMKVSMEMKPENLGSVDVTLITRGQNLVVNVSSNQDTMQMFMQNLPEFKANLMAQGFVSLQMNFNFSENKEQNRNWQKDAAKKYQINNDTKTNNTIESLDIIMPHPKYA